jgi:hypothetical protein
MIFLSGDNAHLAMARHGFLREFLLKDCADSLD